MKKITQNIEIRGARVHNLKNLDIDIPINKLVCLAGPSGSGKTSLAFHTLLTESRRRFINSFPNSLKFFTERPTSVDVDSIYPVLPVFGLPQINPVMGSRSVVSDVMKLTDSLQNLFFSHTKQLCPTHKLGLSRSTPSEQLARIGHKDGVAHLLVHKNDFANIMGEGFIPTRSFNDDLKQVASFNIEDDFWEVLRFKWEQTGKIDTQFKELALAEKNVSLYIFSHNSFEKLHFDQEEHCPKCDFKSRPLQTVSAFSPYSALGACRSCSGYGANLVWDLNKMVNGDLSIKEGGIKFLNYAPFHEENNHFLQLAKKEKVDFDIPLKNQPKSFYKLLEEGSGKYCGFVELKKYLESKRYRPGIRIYIRSLQTEEECRLCETTRLNEHIFHYFLEIENNFYSLKDIMKMDVFEAYHFFKKYESTIALSQDRIRKICVDIIEKLHTSIDLGLGHLKLLRKVKSISAGEYQRLLLIKYLSFKGTDSLFVLDEPSLGLRDNEIYKLIEGLRKILAQGNSVILIDHSRLVHQLSDQIILMGPGSGKEGGEILYQGTSEKYLKEMVKEVEIPIKKNKPTSKMIELKEASIYGKTFNDIKVPLNQLTWIDGPSGSGKTSLFIKVLANEISKKQTGNEISDVPYIIKGLKNFQSIKEVIVVASDLNRFTSRSTIGSMTELSGVVRKHFLKLPAVKSMNLKEGHLSSNSELGMCPKCEGKGVLVIEMQYLEDITLECEECRGLKIKPLYAHLSDGNMTLAEAYAKPISEVFSKIELTPKFRRVLEYVKLLNLDYLSLERPLTSLSGGERQRIYLLNRLLKNISDSLIVFENISFGLSERELIRLGQFLNDLTDFDNTILVIDSSSLVGRFSDSMIKI